MSFDPHHLAHEIYQAANPVIRIHGIGGRKWKRNVAKGARIGPWMPAKYDILDQVAWKARIPCLYLLIGDDGVIRYVGISRNRMADRWRESPAHDAETMELLPQRQLFHSQCWTRIEQEVAGSPGRTYEVRCIDGARLSAAIDRLGPPLSGLLALGGDWEGVCAGVERWMCNNQTARLVPWNVAMTAGLT